MPPIIKKKGYIGIVRRPSIKPKGTRRKDGMKKAIERIPIK